MPQPQFSRRLEVLATLLEPTRARLYRYVVGQTGPVSREQAAKAMRVSRAAAAHHLDTLVEAGLLRASYRRLSQKSGPGAGRPSKLYRRSRRSFDVSLPQRNHELLARLLAHSLGSSSPGSPAEGAAHDYGRSLGLRARKRAGGASAERLLKCAADVLEDLGFAPVADGPSRVWTRSCPFEPLSRVYENAVCYTGLALARGIVAGVGADSIQANREYRPDRCCIVLENAATT